MTLTKLDISQRICDDIGLSKSDSAHIVDNIIDILINQIATHDHVKIAKFGSFTQHQKNARIGRNPKTGIEAVISPRVSISFKPSGQLKDTINQS